MSVAHLRVWWGDEALPLLTELLDWELAYLHTGPCGAHSSHDGHSSDHGSGADGGSGGADRGGSRLPRDVSFALDRGEAWVEVPPLVARYVCEDEAGLCSKPRARRRCVRQYERARARLRGLDARAPARSASEGLRRGRLAVSTLVRLLLPSRVSKPRRASAVRSTMSAGGAGLLARRRSSKSGGALPPKKPSHAPAYAPTPAPVAAPPMRQQLDSRAGGHETTARDAGGGGGGGSAGVAGVGGGAPLIVGPSVEALGRLSEEARTSERSGWRSVSAVCGAEGVEVVVLGDDDDTEATTSTREEVEGREGATPLIDEDALTDATTDGA